MKHFKELLTKVNFALAIIVVVIVGVILILPLFFGVDIGDYGSFVGGLLGTLVGSITVFLVYQTYKLQESELSETRNQLKIQRFESTFFNMLGMFNSIRVETEKQYTFESTLLHMKKIFLLSDLGTEEFVALQYIYSKVYNRVYSDSKDTDDFDAFYETMEEMIKDFPTEVVSILFRNIYHRRYTTSLNRYIRYFQGIVDYIYFNFPDYLERRKYIKTLQMQMTSFEMSLLIYYYIDYRPYSTGIKLKQKKELITGYQFFNAVDKSNLMKQKHYALLIDLYSV